MTPFFICAKKGGKNAENFELASARSDFTPDCVESASASDKKFSVGLYSVVRVKFNISSK